MKLNNPGADCTLLVGSDLSRTTHLAIGAHADDIEIMAAHGIFTCFDSADQWFTGVVCTDGAGSPRAGAYKSCSDEQMIKIRIEEQKTAAKLGKYAAILQLGYSSREAKSPSSQKLVDDLERIISEARPEIIYTHNPVDKHPTHVAVMMATLKALRRLPADKRPRVLYGCEIWRDLDWLPDSLKIVLGVDDRFENLSTELINAFKSQVFGGKRYDLATVGRWRANATYLESHGTDKQSLAAFALDCTALMNGNRRVSEWVAEIIERFRRSAIDELAKLEGRC